MARRQRQRDELRSLCRSGAFLRAIDLAFEHFADFGCDDEVLRLLADAARDPAAPAALSRRLDELKAAHAGAPPVPSSHAHRAPG